MVAIAEDTSTPSHDAVHGAREANRRPGKAPRERRLVVRLDEKMNVIGLHRKVDDSKPRTRGLGERATNLEEDQLLAQAWDPPHGTQGDVHGMIFSVFGPGAVGNAAARISLSPGAKTLASPRSEPEPLL